MEHFPTPNPENAQKNQSESFEGSPDTGFSQEYADYLTAIDNSNSIDQLKAINEEAHGKKMRLYEKVRIEKKISEKIISLESSS